MTTVDLGSAVTSVASCPKAIVVGLVGQTTSTWASDAILLESTALKTDSDGYQFTIAVDTGTSADTASFFSGGCVSTTGNYVCISWSLDATPTYVISLSNRWITKKDWLTTSFVAGTAITLAKWQMKFTGGIAVCTASAPVTANQTACAKASTVVAAAGTAGMNYYQPKETSDLVYVGLPRFQKGESMKWVSLVNGTSTNALPTFTCGTAKTLLGASNLIAGAAVAFGAATLAF
jgi:hypothetical protein